MIVQVNCTLVSTIYTRKDQFAILKITIVNQNSSEGIQMYEKRKIKKIQLIMYYVQMFK